jgi:protein-tyrosine phosphatase
MINSLPKQRHLPLAGVYNLRDLGGYTAINGQQTRWHRIFRADGLHNLSVDGQQALVNAGLRTVIDLRSERELSEHADVFANSDTVQYVHISLFENVGGTPSDLPRDLTTLYLHALDNYQPTFKAVMDTIADHADAGILIHCTAGKDRTGLISALLLGLTDVDETDIVTDYALSAKYLAPYFDARRAEAERSGDDLTSYEPLFLSEPKSMQAVLDHLKTTYNGIPGYLSTIGMSDSQLEKIFTAMIQD